MSSTNTIGRSNSNVNIYKHSQTNNVHEKKERKIYFDSKTKPDENLDTENSANDTEGSLGSTKGLAAVVNVKKKESANLSDNISEEGSALRPKTSDNSIGLESSSTIDNSDYEPTIKMFKNDTNISVAPPKASLIDKFKSQAIKLFKPFTKLKNSIKNVKNSGIKKPSLQKFEKLGKLGKTGLNKIGLNKGLNKIKGAFKKMPTKRLMELANRCKTLVYKSDPMRGLPPELKNDKEFQEKLATYEKASKEAKKATISYNTTRGLAIAKSLGKGVLGVGLGAAIGTSLGALLQLLTNKNKISHIEGHAGEVDHANPDTMEHPNLHAASAEVSRELPDLGAEPEPINLSDLKTENPELANQLQGIFGSMYPNGDFNSTNISPEAKEAADSLVKDFAEIYNSVPSDQREEFLGIFSQEASQVISTLESYAENKYTNTSEVWLKAESASNAISTCTEEALSKLHPNDDQQHSSSVDIKEADYLNSTPSKAMGIGASFGASIGAAVLALKASNKNNNIFSFNKAKLSEKKAAMNEAVSTKENLFREIIAPHIENNSNIENNSETEIQ